MQADSGVIKIDIQCWVQGDVVLECVHLDLDPEREVMMFRVMFNTAFIRSNILILDPENLDILWDSKEQFPKGFRAEVRIESFLLYSGFMERRIKEKSKELRQWYFGNFSFLILSQNPNREETCHAESYHFLVLYISI